MKSRRKKKVRKRRDAVRSGNDEDAHLLRYAGAYSAGCVCCSDSDAVVGDLAVEGVSTLVSMSAPFLSLTGVKTAYASSAGAIVGLVVGAVENGPKYRALGTSDEDGIVLVDAGGGCTPVLAMSIVESTGSC